MAKAIWLLAILVCLRCSLCVRQAAEEPAADTDRWSLGLEASPEDRSLWRRLAELYRRRTTVDHEAVAADAPKADDLDEATTDPLLLRRQGSASATPVDVEVIPPNYFEVSAARASATARPPPASVDTDSGYFDGGGSSDKNLGIGSEVPAGIDPAEAMAACQPPWCYPAKCTGGNSNCPPTPRPTSQPPPPPFVCPPGTEQKRRPDGSGYHCVAATRPCVPACRNGGTCTDAKCACLVGFTGDYCEMVNVRQCRLLTGRVCPYGCRRAGDTFRCVCPPWITGGGLGANDTCVPADPEGGGDGEPCPSACLNGVCRGGVCVCRPGWRGDDCNRDVDECADELLNQCMYQCANTIGSFRCTCPPGYRLSLADGATCELQACPPGCDRHGRCLDGRCVCDPGWTSDDCQIDVNECERLPPDCQQGCANTPGSYRCLCPPGQRLLPDGRACSPADRCEPTCQPATGACVNGSCVCRAGWTGPDCGRDQDECALGFHACQHGCANTPGSFRCLCPPGQRLRPDGRTCACPPGSRPSEADPAICRPAGGSGGGGEGGPDAWRCSEPTRPCQNGGTCLEPSGRCVCASGFYGDFCQKRATGAVCTPPCRAGGTCVEGGHCICPTGRTGPRCERTAPDGGGATCSPACRNGGRCIRGTCVCEVGFEGAVCETRFVCAGSADCDRGWCGDDGRCVCLLGWRGARCDQDFNECDLSPAPCEHTCHNDPGSYRCTCNPGFLPSSNGTCAWAGDPSCPAGCRNEGRCLGGRCRCAPGFQGVTCSADLDECALGRAVHGCEFACHNTPGGWECRCPPGYTRLPDRRTCRRAPPDSRCRPACLNGGVCSGGGTVCACQRGFSGPDCGQDVDECALYRPCQYDCVNTVGSYACRCPPGLLLRFDGIRCITQAEARDRPDLLYRGNGVKGHVINGTATTPTASGGNTQLPSPPIPIDKK